MDWVLRQLAKAVNARSLILLGVLVGVLLGIRAMDSRQKSLHALAGTAPPPAAVAVTAGTPARRAVPAAVTPGWGEDPFARRFSAAGDEGTPRAPRPRPDGGPQRATGLYLQGVMSGPLGRSALINGSVVREGERIGTREVLQIGRRSVLLLENGNVVTLTLQGEGR